jgi:hypothetical protein
MDPYRILGIARSCTLEEVKRAYRAKVWQTHPDLGGDEPTFIEVCEAYKQVLAEVARRPMRAYPDSPRAQPGRASPKPYNRGHEASGRPSRQAQVKRQTPKPPDPHWNPDLVLLDHPIWIGHQDRPPDPDWEPELILLEEETVAGGVVSPSGAPAVSESPVPWLPPFLARSTRRGPLLSRGLTALGITALLGVIAMALFGLLQLTWHAGTGTIP